MLIRCCDCDLEKSPYCGRDRCNLLHECDIGRVKKDLRYRYALVDKLHRAVLERLLDPKNVAKGEFSNNEFSLLRYLKNEVEELDKELNDYGNIIKNRQRVIEECGDVGAYLAAIIDAVEGKSVS